MIGRGPISSQPISTGLLVLAVTLVARDPLYSPQQKAKPAQQPTATANLLSNTLAPSQQAPLRPVIFENHRAVVRAPQNIVQHNLLTSSLTQLGLPLRSQYDPDQLFRKPPALQVDYPNLQQNTLAVVVADPVAPLPWVSQPRGKLPTQPDYTANLLTTSFYVPDENLAREATYTPRVLKVLRQQPNYYNLPPGEAIPEPPDYYFLNDSGFTVTVTRKAPQQPALNTLPLLTATVATLPPKSQELGQPVRVKARVQDIQVPNLLGTTLSAPIVDYFILNDSGFVVTPRLIPRQQTTHNTLALLVEPAVEYYVLNDSGFMMTTRIAPRQQTTHSVLALLTYVAPTLPPKSLDIFQLPKVALVAPQDTSQGQNPDFIPPPVAPPDPPEFEPQTPAGTSKHKHKRKHRRYFVEIDGQQFTVDSTAEAVQLLQRAKALAASQAEQKASIAVKRLRSKPAVPKVKLAAPEITVSPDLKADTATLIADIERLYREAAQAAELRLLMLKQLEAEEDDDDVLLLL